VDPNCTTMIAGMTRIVDNLEGSVFAEQNMGRVVLILGELRVVRRMGRRSPTVESTWQFDEN
jgi:hypothetical protein